MTENEIKPMMARISKFNALKEREQNLLIARGPLSAINGNHGELREVTDMSDYVNYTCRYCEHEFEVEVEYSPPVPGRLFGPPEICYPPESESFELISPLTCPECEKDVSERHCHDHYLEKIKNDKQSKYDED